MTTKDILAGVGAAFLMIFILMVLSFLLPWLVENLSKVVVYAIRKMPFGKRVSGYLTMRGVRIDGDGYMIGMKPTYFKIYGYLGRFFIGILVVDKISNPTEPEIEAATRQNGGRE